MSAPPPMTIKPATINSTPVPDTTGLGAGAVAQVPTCPGNVHVSVGPLQSVSQHTPSTQLSEAQSIAVMHGLPLGSPVAV
jgi:hypothetical protein